MTADSDQCNLPAERLSVVLLYIKIRKCMTGKEISNEELTKISGGGAAPEP